MWHPLIKICSFRASGLTLLYNYNVWTPWYSIKQVWTKQFNVWNWTETKGYQYGWQ